ncbi:MAG: chemotaxis protein CheD [Butyrivibrio sp.]
MSDMIKVGMADLNVCKAPDSLTTLGLGSCIGACLYDPVAKVAGMLHFMLPDSTRIKSNQNTAKFGDTGITELLKQMIALGADKRRIVAKLAGGANMFASSSVNLPSLRVGENNIESARTNLKNNGIRIVAEDVGLNYGRTIEFYADDGRLVVKAVNRGVSTI